MSKQNPSARELARKLARAKAKHPNDAHIFIDRTGQPLSQEPPSISDIAAGVYSGKEWADLEAEFGHSTPGTENITDSQALISVEVPYYGKAINLIVDRTSVEGVVFWLFMLAVQHSLKIFIAGNAPFDEDIASARIEQGRYMADFLKAKEVQPNLAIGIPDEVEEMFGKLPDLFMLQAMLNARAKRDPSAYERAVGGNLKAAADHAIQKAKK